MARPILYDYYRSSAAYRVRIALNLKGVDYESRQVNLLEGEQKSDEYRALNPQGFVPMLEIDGHRLTQSVAIINYLDLRFPVPPLIPSAAVERAHVVALAMSIACDIHPLNNTRVLQYLERTLGIGKGERLAWYCHWIAEGFSAVERLLDNPATGRFCHGDAPTMADVALVPQVANAQRFGCDLEPYPRLRAVNEACVALPAFARAAPANQPDGEAVQR